jgi:energy-coupling factor transporter transmembrane protein EcfT
VSRREPSSSSSWIARLNPTAVFLGTAVLIFAALALPGTIGGIILLVLAAGLGLMLVRAWPAHDSRSRTARVVILGLLVLLAIAKILS